MVSIITVITRQAYLLRSPLAHSSRSAARRSVARLRLPTPLKPQNTSAWLISPGAQKTDATHSLSNAVQGYSLWRGTRLYFGFAPADCFNWKFNKRKRQDLESPIICFCGFLIYLRYTIFRMKGYISMTWDSTLDLFLADLLKRGLKPSTVKQYRYDLTLFLSWLPKQLDSPPEDVFPSFDEMHWIAT